MNSFQKREILESLIGRTDSYMQKADKWFRVEGDPYIALNKHINAEIIIGSYPIYWHTEKARCRFICIDLDAHNENESKEDIREKIQILYSRSKEYFLCDNKHLMVEETDRGFHIWIPLKDKTWLEDAWLYTNRIKPKIEELCGVQEFFPKQSHEGITKVNYGNGVKLPFYNGKDNLIYFEGIHRYDLAPFRREFKKFLNDLKFRTKIDKPKTPDRFKDRHERKRKEVPASLINVYNSPFLKPCMKAVIDGRFQCEEHAGHKMRLAVANELLDIGIPAEEIIKAFSNQDDFDYKTTEKYIEYSHRKQLETGHSLKFRCATIQKLGFCLDNCSWDYRSAVSPNRYITPPEFEEGRRYNREHFKKEDPDGWDDSFDNMKQLYTNKNGKFFLLKTTRSGTTTVSLVEGFRRRKKILMIAPTKRIYNSTVSEALEIYQERFHGLGIMRHRIKSNADSCPHIREELHKMFDEFFPLESEKTFLEFKKTLERIFPFILKPKCETCKYRDNCSYLRFIETIDRYDLIYITMHKFRALAQTPEGSPLLKKLLDWCDVIFIDEFSNILSVNYQSQVIIDEESGFNNLEHIYSVLKRLFNSDKFLSTKTKEFFYDFLRDLNMRIQKLYKIDTDAFISLRGSKFATYLKDHPQAWTKIYMMLFKYFRQTKDKAVKYMVSCLLAMSSKAVYIQQRFTPQHHREISLAFVDDINTIINKIALTEDKLILLTDASIPIIKPKEIFKDLEYVYMGDPNNTAMKQEVYIIEGSDPFYYFDAKAKNIINVFLIYLKEVYNIDGSEVFYLFKNRRFGNYYKKNLGHLAEELSYYRGSKTVGVKCDLRSMVVLGSPHPPRHCYDFIAKMYRDAGYFRTGIFKDMDIREIGRRFENYDAKSAFFQAISRIKDPKGAQRSLVYIYGMKKEEVESYLRGNCSEPKKIEVLKIPKLSKKEILKYIKIEKLNKEASIYLKENPDRFVSIRNTFLWKEAKIWRIAQNKKMNKGELICYYCKDPILDEENCTLHHIEYFDKNFFGADVTDLVHHSCHRAIHV